MALNRPVEMSHERGLAGTPSSGHFSTAAGVVQRLLGEVEVAEEADQRGEDAARLGPVDRVHRLPRVYSSGLQLTIQGIPNRSVAMPKRSAQKVLAMGISTEPPSESRPKIRSASPGSDRCRDTEIP